MKVFISWSGPRSKALAEALKGWIQDVIQTVECFYSSEDIRAGQRWNGEINSWLAETDFGVLCVTPENVASPWLNFEAGALAKRLSDDSRVVPITLGFAPSRLDEPLKQFNGVEANEVGIKKFIKSLAEVSKSPIDIDRTFDRWWGDLRDKINAIPETEEEVHLPDPPDQTDLLIEIRDMVHGVARQLRREAAERRPMALKNADFENFMRGFDGDRMIRNGLFDRVVASLGVLSDDEKRQLRYEDVQADAEADPHLEDLDNEDDSTSGQ